ncbi:MAG: PHP domain-containing protein [Spirochaetaceae bacterium]|jgi:putative hydrolase|nr:PHP domain-containing protein [Spirochaetaceae bacterium]GMO26307.1 MAG: phosphatase [Termitinemataceae bacterium]
MKIVIDTHTHSVASGHAYSTISEIAMAARKRRLKGFVITEHGPALQGFPHVYYFGNINILPLKLHNVRLYRGVELNIMDSSGEVDLNHRYLRPLDFVMAGLHEACFLPQSESENTAALTAAIANPFVDAISHPGNPEFPVNYETVVRAAVSAGKALEINNSSFRVRKGSEANCRTIVRLAKRYGALLCCGSDAHFAADAGNFKYALELIHEEGIHADQVINSSVARFEYFSSCRKQARLGAC